MSKKLIGPVLLACALLLIAGVSLAADCAEDDSGNCGATITCPIGGPTEECDENCTLNCTGVIFINITKAACAGGADCAASCSGDIQGEAFVDLIAASCTTPREVVICQQWVKCGDPGVALRSPRQCPLHRRWQNLTLRTPARPFRSGWAT